MIHRTAVRRIGLCLAAAAVLAAGCARGCKRERPEGQSAAKSTVARGGRLVVGVREEPEHLNSVLLVTKASRLVNNCIFSRFVCYDDSMRLVPDLLAEIPTQTNGGISPDNLTYTYRLRPGVRWHDGHPLSAADVVFTYRLIMNPAVGAETQSGFDVVKKCTALDSLTVLFELAHPYASFVSDTFSDEDVLPEHLLANEVGSEFRAAAFHRAPIGSGPFRFQEWVPASHLTVVRNDDYHRGAPALETIVFRFVPDASALALQLQSRELDGVDGAEPGSLGLLQSLPGTRVYKTASLAFDQLTFNCEDPILREVAVRRALAAATDRAAIATHVFEGTAVPAQSDAHPLMPWYDPAADTTNVYDPERARALLDGAGWSDTDGDGIRDRSGEALRLEITTTAGRDTRERVEAVLQQQWRSIGVDLGIRNYAAPVLFEGDGRLRTGRYRIALFGWQQQPDPAAMEQVYGSAFIPPQGQNLARFRNAGFDSLAALGARQSAPSLRNETYRQVEAILAREVPTLPLVWLAEIDAMPERLREFRPNPAGAGDTWNVHAWWLAATP